jgi:hypothetical protein
MHHISPVLRSDENPSAGKWTFLITNPTVSHSHIEEDGNHYMDEVVQVPGVYQVIAENVTLKKTVDKCLA